MAVFICIYCRRLITTCCIVP